MIRMFDVFMILALLAGATWTFKVKNDSEAALARVAELERRIASEKEAIDLLRADWSLLTSPDRLERLTEQFKDELEIEQMSPAQIVTVKDLPVRPSLLPQQNTDFDDFARFPDLDGNAVTGSVPAE